MTTSAYVRRQFNNAVTTQATLASGGLSNVALSFTVGAGQGASFPDGSVGPFIVTLDQGQTSEERILCDSRSVDTFTIDPSGRAYNGYNAFAHSAGASVLHSTDQQDFDEANQVVHQVLGQVTTQGDLLVGSGANALTRLAKGATNAFLQAGASTLAWVGFGSGQSQSIGSANSDGSQTTPARSDHVHKLSAADSTTSTFTNKRITRRVVTVTQSATPTINTDNTDVASITGLAQAITSMTTNLTGTPVDSDLLEVRITDNGTARAITWGASFIAGPMVPLPTTTFASTLLIVSFEWNTAAAAWVCVGDSGLTYVAGHLASNYTLTGSQATFLTTASLGVGKWLVTFGAEIGVLQASTGLEITTVAGTATATFEGKYSGGGGTGSGVIDDSEVVLTFVATVTAAGTLVFQAKQNGTPTGTIFATTPSFSFANATGYTAIKIA